MFTEAMLATIALAGYEAAKLGSTTIEPIHLLIGLARVGRTIAGGSRAVTMIHEADIDLEDVEREARSMAARNSGLKGEVRMTDESFHLFALAAQIAKREGREGREHMGDLLQAMAESDSEQAPYRVLQALGFFGKK